MQKEGLVKWEFAAHIRYIQESALVLIRYMQYAWRHIPAGHYRIRLIDPTSTGRDLRCPEYRRHSILYIGYTYHHNVPGMTSVVGEQCMINLFYFSRLHRGPPWPNTNHHHSGKEEQWNQKQQKEQNHDTDEAKHQQHPRHGGLPHIPSSNDRNPIAPV